MTLEVQATPTAQGEVIEVRQLKCGDTFSLIPLGDINPSTGLPWQPEDHTRLEVYHVMPVMPRKGLGRNIGTLSIACMNATTQEMQGSVRYALGTRVVRW